MKSVANEFSAHKSAAAVWVLWLSVGQLVGWGSVFYAFSMLLAPVEAELGLSRSRASLAFSLALLVEGLAAFPVGRWIDQGHERAVMVGGSVLACVGLLALSAVQSWGAWMLAWAVLGMAMAATLYTPVFAVVTRRFPGSFRRQIITLTFLGGLASTVFIPLMAWLISTVGWRQMLWAMAALQGLLCVPLHAYLLRSASNRKQTGTPSPSPKPAPVVRAAVSQGYRQALRQPTFALVAVFVVLMLGVSAAMATHLVSLLAESPLPAHWAIALPATIGIVQVIGRSVLFFLEHQFHVDTLNRWTPTLLPLGLLALLLGLSWADAFPALAMAATAVFVALFGLGNGLLTIVKGTAIAQYVNREYAASLNGALGLPTALSRALTPWLLGAWWSPSVGYRDGLWYLVGACVVAMSALVGAQHLAKQSHKSKK